MGGRGVGRVCAFAITAVCQLVLVPDTFAACGNDMDCKGDRICVDGECQSSAPPAESNSRGAPDGWRHGPYVDAGAVFFETPTGSKRGIAAFTGGGYSFGRDSWFGLVDFAWRPSGSVHHLAGIGIGGGWLAKVGDAGAIGLAGTIGQWKMTACANEIINDLYGEDCAESGTVDAVVDDLHVYNVMLMPIFQYGNSVIVKVSPRVLFGTRESHDGNYLKQNTVSRTVSYGVTLGVGYQFGGK